MTTDELHGDPPSTLESNNDSIKEIRITCYSFMPPKVKVPDEPRGGSYVAKPNRNKLLSVIVQSKV